MPMIYNKSNIVDLSVEFLWLSQINSDVLVSFLLLCFDCWCVTRFSLTYVCVASILHFNIWHYPFNVLFNANIFHCTVTNFGKCEDIEETLVTCQT